MSNKTFAILIVVIVLIILGPLLMVYFWEEEPASGNETEREKVEENITELEVSQKEERNAENPYMPSGFYYVEGEVESRLCDSG